MSLLNLNGRFNKIRFLLTIIMFVCFVFHLNKELTKFFEAKATTTIKVENRPILRMPAITICAEQVYDVTVPGRAIISSILNKSTNTDKI